MQYRFEWQIYYKDVSLGVGVVKQEFDTHLEARRFAHRLRESCSIFDTNICIIEIPKETSVFV